MYSQIYNIYAKQKFASLRKGHEKFIQTLNLTKTFSINATYNLNVEIIRINFRLSKSAR